MFTKPQPPKEANQQQGTPDQPAQDRKYTFPELVQQFLSTMTTLEQQARTDAYDKVRFASPNIVDAAEQLTGAATFLNETLYAYSPTYAGPPANAPSTTSWETSAAKVDSLIHSVSNTLRKMETTYNRYHRVNSPTVNLYLGYAIINAQQAVRSLGRYYEEIQPLY